MAERTSYPGTEENYIQCTCPSHLVIFVMSVGSDYPEQAPTRVQVAKVCNGKSKCTSPRVPTWESWVKYFCVNPFPVPGPTATAPKMTPHEFTHDPKQPAYHLWCGTSTHPLLVVGNVVVTPCKYCKPIDTDKYTNIFIEKCAFQQECRVNLDAHLKSGAVVTVKFTCFRGTPKSQNVITYSPKDIFKNCPPFPSAVRKLFKATTGGHDTPHIVLVTLFCLFAEIRYRAVFDLNLPSSAVYSNPPQFGSLSVGEDVGFLPRTYSNERSGNFVLRFCSFLIEL